MEDMICKKIGRHLTELGPRLTAETPPELITARVDQVLELTERAGFRFGRGFSAVSHSMPYLLAFASCKATFSILAFEASVRCWLDGEVNLIIGDPACPVFQARIYKDGRADARWWWNGRSRDKLFPEKLINAIERNIAREYPVELPGSMSEIHLLLQDGKWARLPFGRNSETAVDIVRSRKIVGVLKSKGLVSGIVLTTIRNAGDKSMFVILASVEGRRHTRKYALRRSGTGWRISRLLLAKTMSG